MGVGTYRRRGLDRGDAGELFERGEAGEGLLDAVGPQCAHTARHRCPLELLVARLAGGERRELLVHLEDLEDADPALVAGLAAANAAVAAEELGLAVAQLLGDARRLELRLVRRVELLAMLAEPAREPLGEDAGHGRTRQE